MSQTNMILIFLLIWVNIILNYWILSSMIKRIEKRIARLELLEYFKNNIEIKEGKEEKTLQKKDNDV